MIIEINDYGTQLNKKNRCFSLEREGLQKQISPFRVKAIHIRKACRISSPAILLAAEFSVPILFYNSSGKVKARLWQTHFGSKAEIRRQQLRFSDDPAGLAWVCKWQALKIESQVAVLGCLADRLPDQETRLLSAIEKMKAWQSNLTNGPWQRKQIRALEAQASKCYWAAYFACLTVEKMTRTRPATDPINALLNYGYGMLYGELESAVLTAGLDPQTGVLHREEYNRPAFVFDCIEPFRPLVDQLIAELCLDKVIKEDWFRKKEQVYWLRKQGKQAFIPAWYEMIYQNSTWEGREVSHKDRIQRSMTALAQYLLTEFEAL